MPAELRAALRSARDAAVDVHRSSADGREAARRHAQEVDRVLRELFGHATADRDTRGLALVALGGYGRRELAPHSDLDLLVLHRGPSEDIAEVVRALTYPLWDAGKDLGHRVRDVGEVVGSLSDVLEAASALDARPLGGDLRLVEELQDAVHGALVRSDRAFYRGLAEATRARHERHGHAGHLLEPDVRDAAGGLRDLHVLGWAAGVRGGGEGLEPLVSSGLISGLDRDTLDAAHAFLLRVRFEIHLVADKGRDRLVLAEQDEIARRLGFEGAAPGDALMQGVYRHARTVDAVTSGVLDRLTHKRRLFRPSVRTLGDGCVLREDHVEVVAAPAPTDEPAGWLRAFRHAMRQGAPLDRLSVGRLQAGLATGVRVPWTPAAREVFADILRGGRASVGALEAIDRTGLLEALIPEWGPVRALPQRDLYHRFTVDVHLFETVAELAESRGAEEPDVQDAWSRVGDDEPLLWAALLHDVGKGHGDDHVALGGRMAPSIVRAVGFSEADADDVAFLVREHLLLPELATRRDLDDPATLEETAARTGDPRRLAMLFLHSRADAIATGPEAWSAFRAALIRELYSKTLARLEGRTVAPPGRAVEAAAALASGALPPGEVRTEVRRGEATDELLVAAGDRPGLLSVVCGVLALRGVDVLRADVDTRPDGTALEALEVRGSHGRIPEERWERIRSEIDQALRGDLDLLAALRRKADQLPVAPSGGPSKVVVDNVASAEATVVEVHAPDRLGLLRDLTDVLAELDCDVRRARIATYGNEVVDVFYVLGSDGERIVDPGSVRRLEEALLEAAGA